MTQIAVVNLSSSSASPEKAAPPGSANGLGAAEDSTDFAGLLTAQIALPAKDAFSPENLAALLPADETAESVEADEMPVEIIDLAALLPGLPVLMPQAATAEPAQGTALQPEIPAASPAIDRQGLLMAANRETLPAETEQAKPEASAATASNGGSALASPRGGQETAQVASAASAGKLAAAEPTGQKAGEILQAPHLAAAATVSQEPQAGRPVVSLPVTTPLGARGWEGEIGQKITLLANRQESRAELTLTPPHLGRLEVSISISGDQTSATFVSASPAAREALEQALPRLREILAEAGISLGQASVNAESSRQEGGNLPSEHPAGDGYRHGGERAEAPLATGWAYRSEGMIDTFA